MITKWTLSSVVFGQMSLAFFFYSMAPNMEEEAQMVKWGGLGEQPFPSKLIKTLTPELQWQPRGKCRFLLANACGRLRNVSFEGIPIICTVYILCLYGDTVHLTYRSACR